MPTSNLHAILERGTIRVGTTGDIKLLSFKDGDTGNYQGHDVELVQKLAADMGVEVEWAAADWKTLKSGITEGKYDMVTGVSIDIGRGETAGYTLPIIQAGTIPIALKKNIAQFKSWEDINQEGVTVAVARGTAFEDQANELLSKAVIKAVEAPVREYQDVLAGRSLVSLMSTFEASSLVRTYNELAIVPVDAPVFQNGVGILTTQTDQELINYLNDWITMHQNNGFLDELRNKWLTGLDF
ncbi:MAG: transporter substrate-binding domain-containing protein [Spirochaetales bacterium]|nr:transporter substrate-binding domain-containing protein [Spirochaetales bacterium]